MSRRRPVTGGLLVASGLLGLGAYAILGTQFGWPGVLDDPGTSALDDFVAAEQWVRAGFYVFLLSSLVLIPAAYGYEAATTRSQPAARAITAFGVLGAFAQLLGWVRWPLTVPGIADRWTDPGASEADLAATAATYDLINAYGGGALGEHLGWLLQGVWAVGVGVIALRAAGVPRWLAGLGVGLAVPWALVVPVATAVDAPAVEFVGNSIYTAWYLWLLAFGAVLATRRVGPPPT